MSTLTKLRKILTVSVLLLAASGTAFAIPVTLAWDRNAEPDVAGYRVSYGTASGVYTATVDAGDAVTVSIDGLTRGATYYFVVRAVSDSGLVSGPSNEVAFTVPMYPPQDPIFYSPTTGVWSAAMTDAGDAGSAPAAAPGWAVRAADFNNDGFTDFLLYNPATGDWYKATYRGFNTYSYVGGYRWSVGWTPYVADFNGDGASDVLLYNEVNGRWCLAVANGPGDFAYVQSGVWSPGWTITVANLNADGRADLFLYNPASAPDPNGGRWFRVFTAADLTFEYHEGPARWSAGWQVSAGDFDRNGWGDVFLYNPRSGRWFQVLFTGDRVDYREGLWSAAWNVYSADFDGDGRTDLFIYNPNTGRWFQVRTAASGEFEYLEGLWSANWALTVTDFNHDGRSDLYLYNPANGRNFQVVTIAPGVFDYLLGATDPDFEVVSAGSR
jgi:hypothetical protein